MDKTVEQLRTGPASHPDLATTVETPKPGLELLIGSNIFRNTNGVVKIHGKEQLVLEYNPGQGLLLLTIDLYSDDGTRLAHVRRNVLALNQGGQFTIDICRAQGDVPADGPWVRLSHQQSGETVLEARIAPGNKIHIPSGRFYSHKGALVEITPHYCRIGTGLTLFGEIVEHRGRTINLG